MKLKKYISFISREFVFNGHIMSISALVGGLMYIVTKELDLRIEIFLLVYLVFQPIYILDRILDFEKDKEDNKERSNHFANNQKAYKIVFISFVLALLLLNIYINQAFYLATSFLYLSLGLLYTKVFKQLTRYIPLFKNIFVSAFFSLITITIGSYPEDKFILNEELVSIASFIFMLSLAIQIIFDLKDVKADANSGLKTLPVILGKDKSILTVGFLSIIRAFFLLALISMEFLDNDFLVLTILSFVEISILYKLYKKININVMILYAFMYIFALLLILVTKF